MEITLQATHRESVDVLVAGGGIAGLCAAMAAGGNVRAVEGRGPRARTRRTRRGAVIPVNARI